MRRVAALAAAAVLLAACSPDDVVHRVGWFATMRHQRSIRPYVKPLNPVEGTVPVTGSELPVTLATADKLVNPRTRTSESINRGQWVYQTYCQVCHGDTGKGDGPISALAGGPFIGIRSLVTDTVAKKSDGYLYGVIVNAQAMGRGLMPRYDDKVRGSDRWDVVNYLRALQLQARAGRGNP